MKYIPVLILILASCTSQQSKNAKTQDDFIQEELNKWNIEVIGKGESEELMLPDEFKDHYWTLVNSACIDAGYYLERHAGETITLTVYPINEIHKRDSLQINIFHKDEKIIGLYKSVMKGSAAGSGIMSVKTK
jgi:hypothetical protein